MVELDKYPSFITIDGGEGGTGATFKNYKMVLAYRYLQLYLLCLAC